MPIQIGQKLSPTFREPLALLSDCHRRVENFLRTLILVAEQAHGRELDSRQREALETALRYFREAAPRHTADEEESLFPRMRNAGGSAAAALEKIKALESDHRVAEQSHAVVEELGQTWLRFGQLSFDEISSLRAHLSKLQSIYERHIAIEDNEVFPVAAQILNQRTLQEVGREMAERRGQDFEHHTGPGHFKFHN